MADYYWKGGTTGSETVFSEEKNWVTASGGSTAHSGAPGATDDVIFDLATMTVFCDLNTAHGTTIKSMTIQDALSAETIRNSVSSRNVTIKETLTVNEHSVFAFTHSFTFIFDGSGTQLTVFDGAGSSSGVATTHIKLGLNSGESMFATDAVRALCTFDFTPDSGTNTMTLVDGQYPNMTNIGTVSAKYITSDANATAFNTYGSVDILNWSGGSVTSTARNIYDYDKEFFFEALTSVGEFFQFGHTTARFKSGGANLRLPVFSDAYTNFGDAPDMRFHVQYNKIIIEAGDNASYFCFVQTGKTLYCNELIVRDGGRLYGPAEGGGVVGARIESIKRPTIHGDWNFRQVADGIYETIGTSPLEPVLYNYNGSVSIGTTSSTAKIHINNNGDGDAIRLDVDSSDDPDSTPFVVAEDGRVGIGTASPVSGKALTLNGDGTSYEGIAFQTGGSTKFQMSVDSSNFYHDNSINQGGVAFRNRTSGGSLKPGLFLDVSGDAYVHAIGNDDQGGSAMTPMNALQINVGKAATGVYDKSNGLMIVNNDGSNAADELLAGIGFDSRGGNVPSSVTEASAGILAYASQPHTETEKGGYLTFITSATDDNDDTASHERMRIEADGGVQMRKRVIKAVSTNTSLTDADSGKTIYWTGGSLTLPDNAEVGQQFIVINNTNGAATPALGSGNAIATNWTSHSAMSDETVRTYVCPVADKWIFH